MQTKGEYSGRRRDKRRDVRSSGSALEITLPGQNKRYGDRRCDPRRRNERLNVTFDILLLDHNGKTINVSARGVYFEVITNDMEAFSPGTEIPLQINTVTNAPGSREKKLNLSGKGTVIRNCIIENPDHENILGVAVEFTEKLNIVLKND
ncbi:MAG: PilZ domain-containing protein [Candidatus Scalindua sp.]